MAKRAAIKTPPPDIRLMKVPRGYSCSACVRKAPRLVVITNGSLPYWYGFCASCVDEMAEAAE